MPTSPSQQFLVCDNSTAVNFKGWAQPVSDFIRAVGWTNSSDTGQLNGAGGGVWSGVTTVPGSAAYYYEIFQPGDGLTGFYLKVEYGNGSGTNSPTIRISASTTTNGSGTLTGFVTTATALAATAITPPSTTTTYECDFAGNSGKLSMLLWRNAPNNAPQGFAVQRSLNASGAATGTYVTIWTNGLNLNTSSTCGYQQSLDFTHGPAPVLPNRGQSSSTFGWAATGGNFVLAGSSAFNGGIPISNAQPCVGLWDYPCTVVGIVNGSDLSEGVPFSITNQYGQTVTYMPSKNGPMSSPSQSTSSSATGMCCWEYD